MKLYIAGPMTGYDQYNVHAFNRAQRQWRLRGHEVVTPFELNSLVWRRHYGRDFDPATDKCDWGDPLLAEMFAEDVAAIAQADGIVLIRGWHLSKGAITELLVAQLMGKTVFEDPYETPVVIKQDRAWHLNLPADEQQLLVTLTFPVVR